MAIQFLALVVVFSQTALSQWELMDDFYATTFTGSPSVACNKERLVAVHWNKQVYESDPRVVKWHLLSVLPTEVPGRTIRGIHLSPANEIYIVTERHLYVLDEATMEWRCLTKSLVIPAIKSLGDVAINNEGVILLSTHFGLLYRSTDRGNTWVNLDTQGQIINYYYLNPVQFSPQGTLYVSTDGGLSKSYDNGTTFTPVSPSQGMLTFEAEFSNNAVIVVDDTTIWGCTNEGDVYKLNTRLPQWELIRAVDWNTEYFPRIGMGDDGTLYYRYSGRTDDGVTTETTIDWSTDNGATWRSRIIPYNQIGYQFSLSDILRGDSNSVLTYEHIFYGGEMYEVDLKGTAVHQRAASVAQAFALYITHNNSHIMLSSGDYDYFYDKRTGTVEPWMNFDIFNPKYNTILKDNGWFYRVGGRGARDQNGNLIGSNVDLHTQPFGAIQTLLCGFVAFVLTGDGDIIGVNPIDATIRLDSVCTFGPHLHISDFMAEMISINRNDQYLIVDNRGEFEYFSTDNILLAKGRLEPFMDSIGYVQNDTRGNFILLGKSSVYATHDYGATWERSLIPNNGAAMSNAVVDHRDNFYAMDYSNGVYWSKDGGASFVKLPISFDSLFCDVTDIDADEEYLYCCTSGCGVFRMALPSLNGLETPRPVATMSAPINLYVGNEPLVKISAPFILDGSTMFRMTDISGKLMNEVIYTVDVSRSTLSVQTQTLPSGVYPFMISSMKDAASGKLIIRR